MTKDKRGNSIYKRATALSKGSAYLGDFAVFVFYWYFSILLLFSVSEIEWNKLRRSF